MKFFKQLQPCLSEIYLIASVLYYWFMTGNLANPNAITLLVILGALLVSKNLTLGITMAIVFLLLNFYMVLALISEFNEFDTFNLQEKNLMIFGTIYLGLNIIVAITMAKKWYRKKNGCPHVKMTAS